MLHLLFCATLLSGGSTAVEPVKPVPFTDVRLHDSFWAPKIEVNRTITIPYAFQKCEENGRLDNFINAAKAMKGELGPNPKMPLYPFDDSDEYKVLEGASYSLSVHPDPKLDAYLDHVISLIAAAQEPDGYLYTARTINPKHPHPWSGPERWVNEEQQSHELYDLGHLYEAAVAHYQSTGKKSLLNVAIKSANLLDRTFGPGKRKIWPGHEVVEMGLVKLGLATHTPRYIRLAKFFLDCRGGSGQYWQADKPVVEQTEAVGHAVRAAYLYSGMADVAAQTGDPAYVKAIDTIWRDVVDDKLYVTGGIGARGSGEAFGGPYELPNASAYCETCAAVGNDFWNQRLFLLHADSRYVDVLERTLYNGLLSGVGLDGKSFFYPNPLESRGQNQRSPWFGVPCCPGNITRFMPSIPGYFYAQQGDTLYVNLFASSTAHVQIANRDVQIDQTTLYPWEGNIKIAVSPSKPGKFTLAVRVPGWARNEAVPSNLYQFASRVTTPVTLSINGRAQKINLQSGYAMLSRTWRKGDSVQMVLPMPVRRIVANSKVADDRGKVALQRGPIVYCAEWPDNGGGKVRNLLLPSTSQLTATYMPTVLNGITEVRGTAEALSYDAGGKLVRHEQPFTAIPYYSWANRGKGEMEVWVADQANAAHPQPMPTIASASTIRASRGTNPGAINDGEEPANSIDQANFFHWWPKKGTMEWVEMTFQKPAEVSQVSLYWFDDTGLGECRVPESWKLLYKDGNDWKPVETNQTFGVAKDRYNDLKFNPVTTTALRIEVKLQDKWSAGIQEWKVK